VLLCILCHFATSRRGLGISCSGMPFIVHRNPESLMPPRPPDMLGQEVTCCDAGAAPSVAALTQDDKQLQEAGLHVICKCLSIDSEVARAPLLQAGALEAAVGLMQSDTSDIQVQICTCPLSAHFTYPIWPLFPSLVSTLVLCMCNASLPSCFCLGHACGCFLTAPEAIRTC
jgi:hypothetical protein